MGATFMLVRLANFCKSFATGPIPPNRARFESPEAFEVLSAPRSSLNPRVQARVTNAALVVQVEAEQPADESNPHDAEHGRDQSAVPQSETHCDSQPR